MYLFKFILFLYLFNCLFFYFIFFGGWGWGGGVRGTILTSEYVHFCLLSLFRLRANQNVFFAIYSVYVYMFSSL